jgi:hypothetical protein
MNSRINKKQARSKSVAIDWNTLIINSFWHIAKCVKFSRDEDGSFDLRTSGKEGQTNCEASSCGNVDWSNMLQLSTGLYVEKYSCSISRWMCYWHEVERFYRTVFKLYIPVRAWRPLEFCLLLLLLLLLLLFIVNSMQGFLTLWTPS